MRQAPQTAAEIRRNWIGSLPNAMIRRVAQALYQGTPPDAGYTLDEADLLGGFLRFLRQTAILAHWQTLPLAAVRHVCLPPIFLVLLYGVRVL